MKVKKINFPKGDLAWITSSFKISSQGRKQNKRIKANKTKKAKTTLPNTIEGRESPRIIAKNR